MRVSLAVDTNDAQDRTHPPVDQDRLLTRLEPKLPCGPAAGREIPKVVRAIEVELFLSVMHCKLSEQVFRRDLSQRILRNKTSDEA